jgi:hypothetical protein
MQVIEGGPLFNLRFGLRTLLYAVTAACIFLAFLPLIETDVGFAIFSCTFLLFSSALTAYAVWLATRNSPQYLGRLMLCHLVIAVFLLVGPIISYHLNGRAWYDYGLTSWDPPLSRFRDGTLGISDYDPKHTLPATWPVIGPILFMMCWLSVGLMVFPPTGPIVLIALFVSMIRLRQVLSPPQNLLAWMAWAFGSVPVFYLICWGGKVLDWIAD